MGKIRLLDDALIDRIAAGEVVERPGSVVKELVENSLDAGASRIDVEVLSGGRDRIVVTDDGSGMDRADAELCLQRHGTSKLLSADDLDRIATLGFRGEALSSIAAVSRFRLETADRDGIGTAIEVDGGKVGPATEIGRPQGTTVRVERLFHNVPARRKFLRTKATELSHIARVVTRYSLACPAVAFRLRQGDRTLVDVGPVAALIDRIRQLFGAEFARKLLPFDASYGGIRVHGRTARPVDTLPRRDAQYLFVNGRVVQDRVLIHAVGQAYENAISPGRYPAVFLFIDVPNDAVDVNVHPQKLEVRFGNSRDVHQLVRGAVKEALAGEVTVPDLGELRPSAGATSDALHQVREATLRYETRQDLAAVSPRFSAPRLLEVERGGTVGTPTAPTAEEAPREAELTAGGVRVLAQYRQSYIVAQDESGLLLLDQHAAHERVLFERFLRAAEKNEVERQRLLFPAIAELSAEQLAVLEEESSELRRLGFDVEPFGERSARVLEIPAIAEGVDPVELFLEILGVAGEERAAASAVKGLRYRLITTASCKAAIKIRHALTLEAMQALVDDLLAVEVPSTCPHGRPLVFRLPHAEIEAAFDRR